MFRKVSLIRVLQTYLRDFWLFPHKINLIIISYLPPCQSFFRINQPSIRNVARELCATERGSGRVVIAIGHRAVGAGDEILCLAERLGAPVLTRLDAILGRQFRNVQKNDGFPWRKRLTEW